MMPFDPAGPFGGAMAAAVGAIAGWLLVRVVGGWLAAVERDTAVRGDRSAVTPPTESWPGWAAAWFLVAVVALWWWEVRLRGGSPPGAAGAIASPAVITGRWLAHVGLLWFLAAATWTDLRYRVIPDWITVTGLLVGLAAVAVWPTILLPVTTLVAREFAVPLEVSDVLGWSGPLLASTPHAPHDGPVTLLAAAAMFVLWWWICTGPDRLMPAEAVPPDDGGAGAGAPAEPSPSGGESTPRVETGRWAVLVTGVAAIGATWWWGGRPFAGLFSALVGMVVCGGLVWATRAGASVAMRTEAMGMGDVTLMAMVGAWVGWQAGVLGCFLGVLAGLVHGLALMAMGRGNELPFGPGLCVGTVLTVAAWRVVWPAAAGSFAEPWRMAAVLAAVVGGSAVSLWVWGRLSAPFRRALLVATVVLLALVIAWISATKP